MANCRCCITAGLTTAQLLQLQAVQVPYAPPSPVAGVTYQPQTVPQIGPVPGDLPNTLKWEPPALHFWATLARASYAPSDSIPLLALEAFGEVQDLKFVANSESIVPGYFAARFAGGILVVVSGTTNDRQRINYVLSSLQDNRRPGEYGVNHAFWSAAQEITSDLVQLDSWRTLPVFFVGHSYGGAIAGLASFQTDLQAWATTRQVVTFSAPAWGTAQLCPQISATPSLRFYVEGDAVPFLPPPSAVTYAALAPTVSARINPGEYRHCRPGIVLQQTGAIVDQWSLLSSPAYALQQAAAYINGDQSAALAHSVPEIVRLTQLSVASFKGDYRAGWRRYENLDEANARMDSAGL